MTNLQKIAVIAATAALIGAIATAFHQTKEAAMARAEAQKLYAQQASLAGQISDLHQDLANMTNQLAELLAENSRLKNNSNEMELLKLRSEVTRLRPLQDDVVALQKELAQSSRSLLAEWKTNDLADVGRSTPIDAIQSYIYSSQNFNPAKLQNSIVGDDADPPDKEELQNFIKSESNHPEPSDGVTDYKILSQTSLGPDKVQVVLNATFSETGMGLSIPFTLRNVNGEWKLVAFNVRDKDGKFNHIGFMDSSLLP